ncbi:MAG TPA: hypothetical protein VG276_29155 [Actinomycetes bacterium]|nr:hypothetical protein [Actinomycetes bacterium]
MDEQRAGHALAGPQHRRPGQAEPERHQRDEVGRGPQRRQEHRQPGRHRPVEPAADRPVGGLAQRAAQRRSGRPGVLGGVHVLPPAPGGQGDGPQRALLGQAGHGTGQRVVTLGGRLALAAEDPRGEQECAAVDGWLVEVLAQRDRGAVHDPHPGPLGPGGRVRPRVDQHGRLPGPQQPVQRPLCEHVVGGEQREQRLAGHRTLDSGERGAVAVAPLVGVHGPDPAGSQAPDDGRDRAGVVADHDHHLLQPAREKSPHRPFGQAQAAQAEQGLGSSPGEPSEPLGPAGGEHDPHPRQRRRGGPGRGHRSGGRGERVGWTLRCASHAQSLAARR